MGCGSSEATFIKKIKKKKFVFVETGMGCGSGEATFIKNNNLCF
jgi:hypothetical protein